MISLIETDDIYIIVVVDKNQSHNPLISIGSPPVINSTSQQNKSEMIDVSVKHLDEIEKSFRERYSEELKTKKQQIYDKHRGYNELEDERRSVRQQMMRTPGRRGEIIKEEEISKEYSRRYSEHQEK